MITFVDCGPLGSWLPHHEASLADHAFMGFMATVLGGELVFL